MHINSFAVYNTLDFIGGCIGLVAATDLTATFGIDAPLALRVVGGCVLGQNIIKLAMKTYFNGATNLLNTDDRAQSNAPK